MHYSYHGTTKFLDIPKHESLFKKLYMKKFYNCVSCLLQSLLKSLSYLLKHDVQICKPKIVQEVLVKHNGSDSILKIVSYDKPYITLCKPFFEKLYSKFHLSSIETFKACLRLCFNLVVISLLDFSLTEAVYA